MTEPGADDLLDLEESPYLRRERPIEVRRSRLKNRAARLKQIAPAVLALAVFCVLAWQIATFGLYNQRFIFAEQRLEVLGLRYVARRQVAEKFSADESRSVFLAPLERRRSMVEEIPWVSSAAVARVWPDRIRVVVRERTPIAFLRTGGGIALIDAQGVILERPPRASFTFPVLSGITERDPPEARREKLRLFLSLMEELDRDGAHHTLDLSEVDLSDPEDARAIVAGRDGSPAVLIHLGNSNFRARYQTYLAHIREWRQQFDKIQSIDLRYERQIVVNPDRR